MITEPSAAAKDPATAERLWCVSEQLTETYFPFTSSVTVPDISDA
ncbi:hypothetical protein [Nocardia paucivorans]